MRELKHSCSIAIMFNWLTPNKFAHFSYCNFKYHLSNILSTCVHLYGDDLHLNWKSKTMVWSLSIYAFLSIWIFSSFIFIFSFIFKIVIVSIRITWLKVVRFFFHCVQCLFMFISFNQPFEFGWKEKWQDNAKDETKKNEMKFIKYMEYLILSVNRFVYVLRYTLFL